MDLPSLRQAAIIPIDSMVFPAPPRKPAIKILGKSIKVWRISGVCGKFKERATSPL
jgi:hypothetical protein